MEKKLNTQSQQNMWIRVLCFGIIFIRLCFSKSNKISQIYIRHKMDVNILSSDTISETSTISQINS